MSSEERHPRSVEYRVVLERVLVNQRLSHRLAALGRGVQLPNRIHCDAYSVEHVGPPPTSTSSPTGSPLSPLMVHGRWRSLPHPPPGRRRATAGAAAASPPPPVPPPPAAPGPPRHRPPAAVAAPSAPPPSPCRGTAAAVAAAEATVAQPTIGLASRPGRTFPRRRRRTPRGVGLLDHLALLAARTSPIWTATTSSSAALARAARYCRRARGARRATAAAAACGDRRADRRRPGRRARDRPAPGARPPTAPSPPPPPPSPRRSSSCPFAAPSRAALSRPRRAS